VKRCNFKGCTNQVKKEEFVSHMALRLNNVASRDVPIMHRKHGATRKRCIFEGCTNGSVKGGVCYRHREKSGINTNNNLKLVTSANVTPPIPPHQSIDSDGANTPTNH
jgi:hypothetical protein